MNADVYILADGRDVPARSPLARYEREVLAEHLEVLRKTPSRQERVAFVERIGISFGPAYRAKLEAAYTEEHTRRKAAKEATS